VATPSEQTGFTTTPADGVGDTARTLVVSVVVAFNLRLLVG